MNPKISVIIPFHNNELYLEKCIRSVLDQSYTNLEIFCVNNNSTDGSLDIVNFFSSISSRVFVLSNLDNIYDSINNVILNSNGEYILIINPNSFLNKNYINNVVDEAVKSNLDIVFSKNCFFDNESDNVCSNFFNRFNKSYNYNISYNFLKFAISTSYNNLYKKDFLLKNDILFKSNKYISNILFFYESFVGAKKWKFINEENFYHILTNDLIDNPLNNLKFFVKDNINFQEFISELMIFLELFCDNLFYEFIVREVISLSFDTYFSMESALQEKYYFDLKDFFIKYGFIYFDLDKVEYKFQSLFENFIKSSTFDELCSLNNFKDFSIIVLANNSKHELNNAIDSILYQDFGFKNNVELILIGDEEDDKFDNIYNEYVDSYPNNIKIIKQNNLDFSLACNLGLIHSNGRYINFIDCGDKFSLNALTEVFLFFKEHNHLVDIVSMPAFNSLGDNKYINEKFQLNSILDLNNSDFVLNHFYSCFIRKSSIGNNYFQNGLTIAEGSIFLNKVLLKSPFIGVLDFAQYYSYNHVYDKSIFNNIKLLNSLDYLLCFSKKNHGKIPIFIQNFVIYIIDTFLISQNFDNFDSSSMNTFFLLLESILDKISIKNLKYLFSEDLNYFLTSYSSNNEILLEKISLDENKNLLTLFFNQDFFFDENVDCFIENNFYKLEGIDSKKIMGCSFFKKYSLTIPISFLNSSFKLVFKRKGFSINYILKLKNNFNINSNSIICNLNENNVLLTKLNNSCKVSIIVPVYNVENYLHECLDSICNQTLKDIEIICIDDGSSDNSLKILQEYSHKDNRLRVISKENGGQGVARNLGMTLANGEYIGFVDSDDWIAEDMFEKLYSKACENDLDFNMCKLSLYDQQTGDYDNSTWYYGLKHFDSIDKDIFNYSDVLSFLTSISVTPVNKIYKRNFLLNHNLNFAENFIFEDEAFFYSIIFKASKFSLIKEELYYYRINRKNSTVTETNNNKDIVDIYKLVREYLINNGFEKFIHMVDNKFLKNIFSRFYQSDENHRKLFFIRFKELLDEFSLKKELFYNDVNIKQKTFIIDEDIKLNFEKSWTYLKNLDEHIFHNLKKFIFSDSYDDLIRFNKSKEFSIVMAVYNTDKYLEEAILSIIDQDFGFESNVELILVDDGSTDASRKICLKYVDLYPNNIKYVYQENHGQGTARNFGLSFAKGKYINFLDSDDKLNFDVLSKVHKFFEENYDEIDVVAIPIFLFEGQTGEHVLNYKFSSTKVVDLLENPSFIQLSAASSFIKRHLFNSFKFNQELVVAEDALLINQILLQKNKLGVVSDAKYWYRKRINDSSTMDSVNNLKIYLPKFELFYKGLFNYAKDNFGYIPEYIQFTIMYDLKWYLYFTDIENILSENILKSIYQVLNDVLQEIDDKIIDMQHNFQDSRKKYVYCLKYADNHQLILNFNKLYKYAGKNKIDFLNYHRLYIDIVDIKSGLLNISGMLRSFFTEDIVIQAVKFNIHEFNNSWIKFLNQHKNLFLNNPKDNITFNLKNINKLLDEGVIKSDTYNSYFNKKQIEFLNEQNDVYDVTRVIYPYRDEKLFGLSYQSSYCFDVSIPLTYDDFNVAIRVNYNNFNFYLDTILFDYSGLSEDSWYSKKEDKLIMFKNNFFNVRNYSKLEMIKLELKNINFLKKKDSNLSEIINIRKKALLYKVFLNKKIWLFMDRREYADDNAEALFKYSLDQKDGIKKYFVINKDSIHFNRLQQYGNIIEFGSIKHKLLYLLAEKIISSHPDEEVLNPFWPDDFKYISGIISSRKIFLQHGITKDNVSKWLKKYDKHLDLLVTVSDIERNSFLEYSYNYDDDIVQVLGFPRYDNLVNDDNQKQILIMPSWRNTLEYKSDDQIKKSLYFNKFNSLVNNQELIEFAKSKGYKIIFKPHPNVYEFIHLFDRNDYVIFDEGTRYQDLFNTSSLLITDYSSVAFDFAYLKKPILYYQYANDYNFNEGYFDYETMGFGEIFKSEKDLLDTIKNYLEMDCIMKEKYSMRVDNFYKYSDKNNCKRVYDVIKEL